MEDDRIEANNDAKPSDLSGVKAFFGALIAGIVVFSIFSSCSDKKSASSSPPVDAPTVKTDSVSNDTSYLSRNLVSPANAQVAKELTPADYKKDYIKSCQKVGSRRDPIYLKEFLKSPDKFKGNRISILGKIMFIEEDSGRTVIQMYVNSNFDTVVVRISESVKVYDGDVIQVYGEGDGTFEGVNRMGASMSWPLIAANYISLKRHAEE